MNGAAKAKHCRDSNRVIQPFFPQTKARRYSQKHTHTQTDKQTNNNNDNKTAMLGEKLTIQHKIIYNRTPSHSRNPCGEHVTALCFAWEHKRIKSD